MPTLSQIENADPLTQDQADDMVPALRSCKLYSNNRALYTGDLAGLLLPYVGADTRTSRLLSAIHGVVFEAGYSDVALQGGRDAVFISTTEDRERELALALDTMVDRPIGATVNGNGNGAGLGCSAVLTNRAVW